MERATNPETISRASVRLFVDFRGAAYSQIQDYISQLKGLVRNVAAFSYLMIDSHVRPEVFKVLRDLQLDDYVYLDLDPDHRLVDLKVDMIITTSQRIHLYTNIQSALSGKANSLDQVMNADHISIKQILHTVREVYLSPSKSP
jgi:hypothetical protein